ncbi:site-specific integrase [Riemerella columbina]|uniref:site-specific integrase n=1 Tax=Riemerella columbina TaxID=103810 RepID=UPI0003781E9E|nr:site-specific integrase [Riemerella columbina]
MKKQDLFLLEVNSKRLYNSMKTKFYLHSYLNSNGERQIIFSVSISGKRKRIYTGYYCKPELWNPKTQRLKTEKTEQGPINLILDNMVAKATEIRTFYTLSKKTLSLEFFLKDFLNKTPSYDFNSFMISRINETQNNYNTIKKHKSIHNKLKKYQERIPFNAIDLDFIREYRKYLSKIGNNKTTINSNIKIIKQYLLDAEEKGIVFGFSLKKIETGSTTGNRVSLTKEQVKRLKGYYFSDFIKNNWKLSLGYFLIACYTGLRVSDVLQLRRINLHDETIAIKTVKGKKIQNIKLNNTARKIIEHTPELMDKFYTEQTINKHLKEVAKMVGIKRKLSMHIGRHTFATAYIKAGGNVVYLQKLLGHSKLETTLIYTHITEDDANDTIFILDED